MAASDILVTFEDTYQAYTTTYPKNPAWVASYPDRRFWHLVLSADMAALSSAVSLARSRNAGWIYVTSEGPSTAYQNIETGPYWAAELADVAGP